MKIIYTIAFLLSAFNSWACSCGTLPEIKSKDELTSYDFIALVDIKGLAPITNFGRQNGDIKISVVELFRGTASSDAIDPSFNSSCALSLNEGEQWLFFGFTVNGKINVGACTYTMPYRDAKGIRQWNGGFGIKRLATLRAIFDKPDISGAANKVFYPGGTLEIEQNNEKGVLNGVRKIYYPSGKLFIQEKFAKGKRVNQRNIYTETGQLLIHETYKNGHIAEYTFYHDTVKMVEMLGFRAILASKTPSVEKSSASEVKKTLDSLRKSSNWGKQIWCDYKYSDDGKSFTRKFYEYDGKLSAETLMEWDKGIQSHKMYYPDGKIRSDRTMDNFNNKVTSYTYNQDGTRKEFVGKCESCRFYFDINTLPSAPEPVYIQ